MSNYKMCMLKSSINLMAGSSSVDSVVISSNTAIENNAYNMSCEVSGDPLPTVSWIKVNSGEHRVGKILNFTAINRMMPEVTHVKQVIDVEKTLRLKLLMCSVSTLFCMLVKFWFILVTNYDKGHLRNFITLFYRSKQWSRLKNLQRAE